jgi:poly(hydroxyalkanoate) granule-associated protein
MSEEDKNTEENAKSCIEPSIAEKVKESASQIWLAGLGAYSKAEKEGNKLFDTLVRDGERLEDKTRSYLDRQINVAREKVEEVKAKASGSWNKVERAFDERVATALHRLNIPVQSDVQRIVDRLDQLAEQIEKLAEQAEQNQTKQS